MADLTWIRTDRPADKVDKASDKTTPDAVGAPQEPRHFPIGDKVNSIACSADGKRIAVSNGRGLFGPTVKVLDAETGKDVAAIKLTTAEEDAVLAAAEGLLHFEVWPLAFSPDASVLAVGNSIGQVKLFDARTGELVQSLDDEKAKLEDKETPRN